MNNSSDALNYPFCNLGVTAKILNLSPRRVKALAESGELERVKVGQTYLYKSESIKRLLGTTTK